MAKKRTSASTAWTPTGDTRVCVIHGSEPMLRRQGLGSLRAVLEARHGQVESIVIDGRSAGLADVLDELRSFGLMRQYKLVVVDEADQFVSAHRQALERYVHTPVDEATLVLRCERWHRGKLDGLIEKCGGLMKCDPLSPAWARAWLTDRAHEAHQARLTAGAAGRMVDRLGCDLSRLDSELSKLALFVDSGASIDAQLVDQVVGRSSDEKAWVVQEAILGCLAGAAAGGRGVAVDL